MQRISSSRKVQRKTPGGRTTVHHKRKKPANAQCALCGTFLQGMPRGNRTEIRKLAKSKRKPERPYGGQLCSACTRYILTYKSQLKHKQIKEKDLPIHAKPYILGKTSGGSK